jgi:hypothetical protein
MHYGQIKTPSVDQTTEPHRMQILMQVAGNGQKVLMLSAIAYVDDRKCADPRRAHAVRTTLSLCDCFGRDALHGEDGELPRSSIPCLPGDGLTLGKADERSADRR